MVCEGKDMGGKYTMSANERELEQDGRQGCRSCEQINFHSSDCWFWKERWKKNGMPMSPVLDSERREPLSESDRKTINDYLDEAERRPPPPPCDGSCQGLCDEHGETASEGSESPAPSSIAPAELAEYDVDNLDDSCKDKTDETR